MFKIEFSRKTKNVFRIIGIVCLVGLFLYVVGLITQAFLLMTMKIEAISLNPITCWSSALNFSRSNVAWVIVIIIAILIAVMIMRTSNGKMGVLNTGETDRTSNFLYSNNDNYGSAKQASEKIIRERCRVIPVNRYDDLKGDIILGFLNERKKEYVTYPINDWKTNTNYNRNIAVCGSPGTMKTRTFVINYILQAMERGESVIVSDSKGEIYSYTAAIAKKRGYLIRVLNLVEQEYSDGWDILGEVDSSDRASQLASVIIKNTGGASSDAFWNDAEMNCLKAMILFYAPMINAQRERTKIIEQTTMGDVYLAIATKSLESIKTEFDLLERRDPSHPALIPYKQFRNAGEDIDKKILHGLGNRLQVFQSESIRTLLGEPTIDLTLPGDQKCIYYLRFSDQDSTYEFVTSLFFSFLYIKLVAHADLEDNRYLRVPVNFLLDEFCNIGEIPDFQHKISTVRSRKINTAIIFQNIPQIQNRYPNGAWEEIISDCDTFIFLGCGNELTTPQYVSDLTGEATIVVSSNSVKAAEMKVTKSTGRRMVLTPNQVKTMPVNKELVFIRDIPVMMLTKMDFTLHPKYEKESEVRITDHAKVTYNKNTSMGYANKKRKIKQPDVDSVSVSNRQSPLGF